MTSRFLTASIRNSTSTYQRRTRIQNVNLLASAQFNASRLSCQNLRSSRLLSTAVPPPATNNVDTWFNLRLQGTESEQIKTLSEDIIAASSEEGAEATIIANETSVSVGELLANTGAEYLTWFHSAVSMDGTLVPWSASLVLSAFAIRLMSLPLVYYNQLQAGRAALAGKELPRVQAFVRQTPGTLWQKYLTFRRLRSLTLRSAGTSSVQLFRWDLLVHLPVVVSASMGIRQLAASRPVEWTDGGIAWFTDLTRADPTGALPILTTAFWVWNTNPRSARRREQKTENIENGAQSKEDKQKNAMIQRIMSSRGEWLSTLLQVFAVASLTVTMDMPSGMLVLWASNGAVTALQRYALSSDTVRRQIGLLTAEDIKHSHGPPVLKSTKQAVDAIRKELEYIQREVLTRFPNRSVDQKLMDDVNRVLRKERWQGRISVQLEAVIREDERDGKKYIAVVRKGTAAA